MSTKEADGSIVTKKEPPSMERWAGRVALVTGASSGIGASIAKMLLEAGLIVIGVAENTEKLDELSEELRSKELGGTFVTMKCDIGDLESIRNLFAGIKADPDLEGVDICINNAGIACAESVLSGQPDAWKRMMEVNFLGATCVTQETYKSMFDRNVDDGHIIFINGMSSHRLIPGNPDLHVYSATKAALKHILEAVRLELRMKESRIRVSAVSPGVVETDLIKKLFEGDEEKAAAFLEDRKYLEAEDVAECVKFILSLPPYVQVHDLLVRSTDQVP